MKQDKQPKSDKSKRRRGRPGKPYPEITLQIDDTAESVAKSLFALNPNEDGFEWQYLKDRKQE